MENELENNDAGNTTDYEAEAKEMGWVDKDSFQGEEDKWIDAKTFVERGENILPILRANNKRMKHDLLTRDKEIANLRTSVEGANKSIKALQKHYTEATKQQVEQATKELREQLKQAREIGDVDAELELQDKLQDIRASTKEVKEEHSEEGKEDSTTKLNPDFVAWNKENSWFGDMSTPENRKRTRELIRIGEDLRDDGDTTYGRPFMDKCLGILEKREASNSNGKRTATKVEGSDSRGKGGGGGRAFDHLPKEAKDTCHSDNDTFVGPGKMFKTVKEWEDHFTALYSEE